MTLALFAAAGRGTHIVGRPRSISGVAHLYTGPLTRTGRHVPLRGRPVCGARTRRLSVLEFPVALEAGPDGDDRRVCARCRSCLVESRQDRRQPTAPTRDDLAATYGHLSVNQLAAHARASRTRDEIDLVSAVALMNVGTVAGQRPIVLADGTHGPSLNDVIARRRRALRLADPTPQEAARDARLRARDEEDRDAARRRRTADWEEKQAERAGRRAPHPRDLVARAARHAATA